MSVSDNHYGGTTLKRDLEAQGFTVLYENDKYKVSPPGSTEVKTFHKSSFDRGISGIFSDLGRIGFKKPKERVGATPPKPPELKGTNQPGKIASCKAEGCTYSGKPLGLGRHIGAKITAGEPRHVAAYPERVVQVPQAPTPKPTPRGVTTRQIEPQSPTVRFRNKLQQMQAALAAANEAGEWMLKEFEGMAEENKELKRKVKKFEDLLTKGLDVL